MWDKPAVLNRMSDLLVVLALLGLLYGGAAWLVRLPVFPITEVRVVTPLTHVTREQVESVRGVTLGTTAVEDAIRKGAAAMPAARSGEKAQAPVNTVGDDRRGGRGGRGGPGRGPGRGRGGFDGGAPSAPAAPAAPENTGDAPAAG